MSRIGAFIAAMLLVTATALAGVAYAKGGSTEFTL
jgi:hypothetical protein